MRFLWVMRYLPIVNSRTVCYRSIKGAGFSAHAVVENLICRVTERHDGKPKQAGIVDHVKKSGKETFFHMANRRMFFMRCIYSTLDKT